MAKKLLEKEIEGWFDNLSDELQEAFLELVDVTNDNILLKIGEEDHEFSITYPKDYPKNKEDRFFVFTEDAKLSSKWQEQLNEYADKGNMTISKLLEEAAEKFLKLSSPKAKKQEEEDDDMFFEEEPKDDKKKPKKTQEELEIEKKVDSKGFLEVGSPQATLRLISDLKSIKKPKPYQLGFTADPVVDSKSGLENLYHWHIKLQGFEKGSPLGKDMADYKKKTGADHVLLEMRFTKDYPHRPPFVRVVKPRFAFRTGHVTICGSICMELLTNTGWNATNDIESILIQISAELLSGGARLDPGATTNYEYSEQEAWEAFFRAAGTHGWDIKGMSREVLL